MIRELKNINKFDKILIVGRGPTSRFKDDYFSDGTFTIGFHNNSNSYNYNFTKNSYLEFKSIINFNAIDVGSTKYELDILLKVLDLMTSKMEVLLIGFDFNSNNEDDDLNKEVRTSNIIQRKVDIDSQLIVYKKTKNTYKNLKLKRIGFDHNCDINPKTKLETPVITNLVEIVAEITTNHFGDSNKLVKLIEGAAKAGADSVKLQKRNIHKLYSKSQLDAPYASPFGNTFYDYRMGIELSDDQIDLAIKTSNKHGLKVFFSVLDIESYNSIIDFGLTRVKLPSTISRNTELLEYVSENHTGELVISTGMTDKNYESFITSRFKKVDKLYLLQCISSYPTYFSDSNLSVIRSYKELSKIHPKIIPGYSSHDIGSLGSCMALACGAKMIEKHVKTGVNPWAHFDDTALDIDTGFVDFCDEIRRASMYLGDENKKIIGSEHHKY